MDERRNIVIGRPSSSEIDAWLAEAQGPFATLAFPLGHIAAPQNIVIGGRLPHWLAATMTRSLGLPNSPARHNRPFPLPPIVRGKVKGDATAIGAAFVPLRDILLPAFMTVPSGYGAPLPRPTHR